MSKWAVMIFSKKDERIEPFYLNGLKNQILEKVGGTVDIVEVPEIDIYGQGASTE